MAGGVGIAIVFGGGGFGRSSIPTKIIKTKVKSVTGTLLEQYLLAEELQLTDRPPHVFPFHLLDVYAQVVHSHQVFVQELLHVK